MPPQTKPVISQTAGGRAGGSKGTRAPLLSPVIGYLHVGFLFGCKKQSKEEKPMSKKIMTAAIAGTLLGLVTIAITSGHAQAEKRTFTVAAVEMKGT